MREKGNFSPFFSAFSISTALTTNGPLTAYCADRTFGGRIDFDRAVLLVTKEADGAETTEFCLGDTPFTLFLPSPTLAAARQRFAR